MEQNVRTGGRIEESVQPLGGIAAGGPPRLGVVIPTLNAAAMIGSVLETIGGSASEIIIADGGSQDDTVTKARSAGARVIATGRGRGRQLAAGVAAASSPWLLLLHADTLLSANWYEAVTRHAAAWPEQAGYFLFALASPDWRARMLEHLVALRCSLWALPYGDQGLFIRRSLLEQIGGVRPLPLMEDVDLIRRLGRRRIRPLDATATTSAVRWEQDGWVVRSIRNLACLALWRAGVSPERIARLYG